MVWRAGNYNNVAASIAAIAVSNKPSNASVRATRNEKGYLINASVFFPNSLEVIKTFHCFC